jgi:hypothetical protein
MEVTLGQLAALGSTQGVKGPLDRLMENETFCARLSYKIAKLAKLVGAELQPLNAARNKVIEKYSTIHKKLDEAGQETDEDEEKPSIREDDENWDEFSEEFDALLREKVKLDMEPVVLPPEADGVTPAMFLALDGMVIPRGEDESPSGPTEVVK